MPKRSPSKDRNSINTDIRLHLTTKAYGVVEPLHKSGVTPLRTPQNANALPIGKSVTFGKKTSPHADKKIQFGFNWTY